MLWFCSTDGSYYNPCVGRCVGVFCLGALGVRTVAEVQSPLAAPMFPCARSFNVRIATGGILVGHGLV